MSGDREQKVLFALSREGQGDGAPVIILGIPRAAWIYMRDGETHNFDLTSLGVNIKIVLYGAKDHADAYRMISDRLAADGVKLHDQRDTDFSIKPN